MKRVNGSGTLGEPEFLLHVSKGVNNVAAPYLERAKTLC